MANAKSTLSTESITATRTFTAAALKAEQGRRKNNKSRPRGEKVKAKSWVFPALDNAQIKAVLDGQLVPVEFASGRKEVVGLKG